jgi:hypothetical protein
VFRNQGQAEANHGPNGTVIAGLRDTADLPEVDNFLDENRPYLLHLSGDAAGGGIRIDQAAGTATVARNTFQATTTYIDAAELRRLLAESQTVKHKPTAVVARDADGLPMLFLTNVHVAKPSTAAWMREVRDRSKLSPPLSIAAAVDSAGNVYLEVIRDGAGGAGPSGAGDRD